MFDDFFEPGDQRGGEGHETTLKPGAAADFPVI
jgi:hypothetical protein